MRAKSFVVYCAVALAAPLLARSTAMADPGLYSIPVTTVEGLKMNLGTYHSKGLLIVNTASRCGYTPQYEGLERLSKTYAKQGLVILGFPSNDFGEQEPGSNAEISRFCKLSYHVDFPVFQKAHVSGDAIQPLYSWLLSNAPNHDPVGWNFEKFVVSRKGKIIARFKSDVTPESAELKLAIEEALKQ